ncbi:MAG TPA: 50S ribosomal protein L18 [Nitrospiria bacterium]|nr:50S ribosomal protein L18 [Nitrospiria bacterium]
MATSVEKKVLARERRHRRVRKKILGTTERPRLSVFRSGKHVYAQIIDDTASRTLMTASSLSPELKGELKRGSTRESAKKVGKLLAEKARAAGIEKVVFDRGGYLYHGRIKALADAAREGGLVF